jgi:hypothetical protein
MGFIIFVTQFVCSECKKPLKLYPSEHIPKSCPNCGTEFDKKFSHGTVHNGGENIHTGHYGLDDDDEPPESDITAVYERKS